MRTMTIKDVPQDLYERLKRSAARSRRSLNSEVIVRLERSLHPQPVDPAASLARIDALRERLNLPPLTDAELRAARDDGRA